MIKDGGNHAPVGDTGFVRSSADGKGRMDLLPWNAILELSKHCQEGARIYGERNIDKGAPLHSLLDSGARHLAKVMLRHTDEDHLRAACWNLMWALEQRTTHPELDDMPKAPCKNVMNEPETPVKNVSPKPDGNEMAGVPEITYLDEARRVSPHVICPQLACGALGCPGEVFSGAPAFGRNGCPQRGAFDPVMCTGCWKSEYRGEEVVADEESL